MTGTVDKRALFLGVGAPQHKDEMLLTLVQFPDHSIGEPFPTAASVRSGLMSPHGQNRVDQQNTLIGPALQSARRGKRLAQIALDLSEYVDQRRRERHAVEHREAQPVILPGLVIGVLPDDNRPDAVERATVERMEYSPRRRINRAARILVPYELGQLGEIGTVELGLQAAAPAFFYPDIHICVLCFSTVRNLSLRPIRAPQCA